MEMEADAFGSHESLQHSKPITKEFEAQNLWGMSCLEIDKNEWLKFAKHCYLNFICAYRNEIPCSMRLLGRWYDRSKSSICNPSICFLILNLKIIKKKKRSEESR